MADEQHNAERCPIPQERLVTSRGIEVGHIFYFGTKYSKAMGAHVMTSDGKKIPVEMGSYGIGVSRLVGAMIEAFHDSNGICWPVSVAPFPVAIAALGPSYATEAETYYRSLMEAGLECFLYDLPKSQGSLFAELDLVGIPYQVFFGESWKHTSRVEIKHRSSNERTFLSLEEATSFLTQALTPKNP
jgi:prolyl-tRNA synthetase